jgi:hypothetical protein
MNLLNKIGNGNATMPGRCMRTDRRRDLSKVKGAFCDYANALKTNLRSFQCFSLKSHVSLFTEFGEHLSDRFTEFTVHSLFDLLANQHLTETLTSNICE